MTASLQGSLLDLAEEPELRPLGKMSSRTELSRGAWVDVRPGWLTGAADLFGRLASDVPWRAERRQMYERMVDVPRLLCFYGEGEPLPDPVAGDGARGAERALRGGAGRAVRDRGLCLYRDGRDSVAWHGDTIGRGRREDTMVAILSLGAPRALMLRPRGGGPGQRYELGHGDLIVMGGSCQRTWEHAVPKTARPVGPRISVQFRPRDVR